MKKPTQQNDYMSEIIFTVPPLKGSCFTIFNHN